MAIVASSNNRAVSAQPYGMRAACSDGYDIRPGRDIALPAFRTSRSDNSPLCGEANAVVATSGHGDDLLPLLTAAPELWISGHTDCTALY